MANSVDTIQCFKHFYTRMHVKLHHLCSLRLELLSVCSLLPRCCSAIGRRACSSMPWKLACLRLTTSASDQNQVVLCSLHVVDIKLSLNSMVSMLIWSLHTLAHWLARWAPTWAKKASTVQEKREDRSDLGLELFHPKLTSHIAMTSVTTEHMSYYVDK